MSNLDEQYFFTVTRCRTHCSDDVNRLATPLKLTIDALAAGGDVWVSLTVDGTKLAKKGAADGSVPPSFSPVSRFLEAFEECGDRIGVSSQSAGIRGVTDENMVENGVWMTAAEILVAARERQAFSF